MKKPSGKRKAESRNAPARARQTRAQPRPFVLALRNRHPRRRVEARLARALIRWLLENHFHAASVELCFHFVGAHEMSDVNWRFLQHEGSTDVITFDHSAWALDDNPPPPPCPAPAPSAVGQASPRAGHEPDRPAGPRFIGEIYISLDDAVSQAHAFRTTWTEELTRYIIHGLLHLAGFDDHAPAARLIMKRAEHRLLRAAALHFPLPALHRAAPAR